MNAYIDRHREVYGIEPICKVLQVAQSAYRRHAARQLCPELRSTRARNDEVLMAEIKRVWQANMRVYGARKVWRQLQREGIAAARCTVERLMKRAPEFKDVRHDFNRREFIGRHGLPSLSLNMDRPCNHQVNPHKLQ
jgi:hypothetical protein